MKPNQKQRKVAQQGVQESAEFSISEDDSAHLMTILRDTLYSDKILAVEREYAANAWDANRAAGRGDQPVLVALPTELEPIFAIRDNGPGISREDIFKVFIRYGKSTKRDDNTSVGMLGIGSKSAFAYADTFTVTSWHNGTKSIYSAVLDETNKGRINLLYEEPCGDETGVMIQVPVKTEDIPEFETKAQKLFKFFNPQPDINTKLPQPPPERLVLKDGYIFANSQAQSSDEHGWIAVMGCVPYRINMQQISGLGDHIDKVSGVLFFDIGEVEINASREELKYSGTTKTKIVDKIHSLVDEYVLHILREINLGAKSSWEKMLAANVFRQLHLPVPTEALDLVKESIKITDAPDTVMEFGRKGEKYIKRKTRYLFERIAMLSVSPDSVIYLRDDMKRSLEGYRLGSHDYLVNKINPKQSWDDFEKEVQDFLKTVHLDGIPVKKLTSLTWSRGFRAEKYNNPKYKKTVFILDDHPNFYGKGHSTNWVPVPDDFVPSPEQVYIIMENFRPVYYDFGSRLEQAKSFLKAFGQKPPTIYGYRSTPKNRVTPDMVTGTPFTVWRESLAKPFITAEFLEMLDLRNWAHAFPHSKHRNSVASNMGHVVATLGSEHLVSTLLRRHLKARREWKRVSQKRKDQIELILKNTNTDEDLPTSIEDEFLKEITDRYPLLKYRPQYLWDDQWKEWAEYIQLIDKRDQERQSQSQEQNTKEKENHDSEDPVHHLERKLELRVGGQEPDSGEGRSELPRAEGCAAE